MDVTNFTEPRHLTASEDISGFDCGLPLVNDWLVSTLSAYSIEHSEAPGWLNPIPVILLGMMGVDIRFQTMHVDSQLLRDAVLHSLNDMIFGISLNHRSMSTITND